MGKSLDRIIQNAALRRWRNWAQDAGRAPLSTLRSRAVAARQLRNYLNSFLHGAEGKLALPRIGSTNFAPRHGLSYRGLWRGPLHPPAPQPPPANPAWPRGAALSRLCHIRTHPAPAAQQPRRRSRAFWPAHGCVPVRWLLSLHRRGSAAEALVDLTRQHAFRVDCIWKANARSKSTPGSYQTRPQYRAGRPGPQDRPEIRQR